MSGIRNIPIDMIDAENYSGSLEQLKASIIAHGILCPVCLMRYADRYILISGKRRYHAAKELGMTTLPALVEEVVGLSVPTEAPKPHKPKRKRPVRKFLPKSIGFFVNTVDRALKTMRDSGAEFEYVKSQKEGYIEYNIKIPERQPKT